MSPSIARDVRLVKASLLERADLSEVQNTQERKIEGEMRDERRRETRTREVVDWREDDLAKMDTDAAARDTAFAAGTTLVAGMTSGVDGNT